MKIFTKDNFKLASIIGAIALVPSAIITAIGAIWFSWVGMAVVFGIAWVASVALIIHSMIQLTVTQ